MAEDLFNPDSLDAARGTTQAMVDNLRELRNLGGEFAGQFGRDFLSNATAINKAFNDAIGQAERFNALEVTKTQALNMEQKIRKEIGNSQNNLLELTKQVENTLKPQYERAAKELERKKAVYQTTVKQKGVDSDSAIIALVRLNRAQDLNDKAQKAYELGLSTVDLTKEQIKDAKALGVSVKQYAENWDKAYVASGLFGRLLKGISKIPILGDLFNANKALKVMQKEIIKGEGAFKAFGKGISAAFAGIEKSTVILAVIGAVVKAVQFFISLIGRGQTLVVGLSRELGISGDNAKVLLDRFRSINVAGGNILLNMKSASEAQGRLAKEFGATTYFSDELLDNQVLLAKNLGISEDTAAKLGSLFEYSGKGSRTVFNNVNNLNNAAAKVNGFLVPLPTLLNKMSAAGAEIAGYFKFSSESLAQAVIDTTKFGISLQQANTIAKGLLNFEESIGAELEAELLTGREFNFELARSKALQGDVAGAAAEVLSQVQNLTEEQRKSPIIMESIAKATGLSVEQINEAYLKQTRLTRATKDYIEELERGGKMEMARLAEKYGIMGMSEEQIRNNVTTQEAFNAALEKVKDQLTILDKSGTIDKFTRMLTNFVNIWASDGFASAMGLPWWLGGGGGQSSVEAGSVEAAQNRLDRLEKSVGKASIRYKSALEDIQGQGYKVGDDGRVIQGGEMIANDFTIRTNPQDTLVMAGGTKFGEETNAILRELVDVMKRQDRTGRAYDFAIAPIANALGVITGVNERGVN